MARKNVIEIIINAEDKATRVLGGVGKGLVGLGKIAAGAGLAVAGAAAGIGVALGALAVQAAPLEGIGFAFEQMAERAGLSLDELREASAGTISDFELMRKANIALTGAGEQLGREFGQNMPALLETARAAARATGQDVDFLFESLVTGIKRGSPMLIDNTGLVVKLGEANEAMAAKLGKSVEELTAEEKSIALLNATVEAGQSMIDQFGGGALTAAEKMAQFRATVQNAKDQIGLALLPALQALLEPLAELAQEYGPQVVAFAQRLGEWLGENLPIAIDKLTALLSGEMPAAFQTAWGIIKPIVSAIQNVIVGEVWPALQEAFGNLTEALNTLGLDWSDVWEAIKTAIGIVAIAIGAAILVIIGALTSIISTLAAVLVHVTSVFKKMAKTFKKGLEALSKLIGGAMAIIKGIFSGDLELIMAGWVAWKEGLMGLIEALFEGAINFIELSFGTIIVAVSNFIYDFIAFFVDLKNELVGGSIIKDMMDAMLNAIRSKFSSILSAVRGFVSDFKSVFTGLATSLYNIGVSIMQGLLDGFKSKFEEIKSIISDFVGDIIDLIKEILDILSPSGVMAEIGRNMMEGMALGISQASALPAMAAAGAVNTTTIYFNQTVNTQATADVTIQSFETARAIWG